MERMANRRRPAVFVIDSDAIFRSHVWRVSDGAIVVF